MAEMLYRVALCDFKKNSGWQIRAFSKSTYAKPGIFRFGKIKLLRVPLNKDLSLRGGQFIKGPAAIIDYHASCDISVSSETYAVQLRNKEGLLYSSSSEKVTDAERTIPHGVGDLTLVCKKVSGEVVYEQYVDVTLVTAPLLEINFKEGLVLDAFLAFQEKDQENTYKHWIPILTAEGEVSRLSDIQLHYCFNVNGKSIHAVFDCLEKHSDGDVAHFKYAGLFTGELLLTPDNINIALHQFVRKHSYVQPVHPQDAC